MKRSSKKPAGLRKTVRDIRKGKRSMQTFVWIYFVLFAIVILVVLWLGQYVFLYNYYRSAKVNNISREANRIIQAYGTEEQGHINRTVAYENSMCIVITDTDGNPLTSENNLGSYSKLYDDIEHNYSMYIFELKSALEKEKDNCYTVTFDNDDLNVKEMIYCAKVYTDDSEDQAYLFIESTIEPIDSTVKIIREQLMFISIILFELAIIVGTLAAMRLSRQQCSATLSRRPAEVSQWRVTFFSPSQVWTMSRNSFGVI